MTNREWLMEQMQNMSDEELAYAIAVSDELTEEFNCGSGACVGKDCYDCKLDWLKAEYKEKPKLSEAERVILENIDKEYKWIARDDDGELAVFKYKPSKMGEGDRYWRRTSGEDSNLGCFKHLFQFIKWSDNEAYEISELLKGE